MFIVAHVCLVKSLTVCILQSCLVAIKHSSTHRLNQSCLACICSQPLLDALQPSVENKATICECCFLLVSLITGKDQRTVTMEITHTKTHMWSWESGVVFCVTAYCIIADRVPQSSLRWPSAKLK